jgi:translocation and assembly module TamB
MLLNRRDAQLELDASGDIAFADGTLRLKGDARIVQGHLELLRKAGMPTLASDIKVKTDEPAQPPRQPMRMIVDLSIDFGDRFVVTAKDIGVGAHSALKPLSGDFKARIAGKVRTLSDAKQIPQTTGRLNVMDGTYSMIGRRFEVQRGNLSFVGPLNNPALDIFVAPATTRLRFTPEVGISITGTAQVPRVQLVSQPDMPETEKLSWLLFGRGGQNFDYAVGSTAGQIASPVTEFGWQLSQKLYVAYEQGTTGTANIVRFYSQMTDRIAIQLGTGDANSLYVLYTFTLK